MDTENFENKTEGWKRKKPAQFALMFSIILLMFFAIEVLPLNMGEKHIPWKDIPKRIQHRIPVILLIAGAGSAYVVFGKRPPTDKS